MYVDFFFPFIYWPSLWFWMTHFMFCRNFRTKTITQITITLIRTSPTTLTKNFYKIMKQRTYSIFLAQTFAFFRFWRIQIYYSIKTLKGFSKKLKNTLTTNLRNHFFFSSIFISGNVMKNLVDSLKLHKPNTNKMEKLLI